MELLEYFKFGLFGRVELDLLHMDLLGGSSHLVSHLTIKGDTIETSTLDFNYE